MEIVKLDYSKAASIFAVSLKVAAITGALEVVEVILSSFPGSIYLKDELNQTIFHLAIANRRENIFNLVYQFKEFGNLFVSTVDNRMNNGLHLAGRLESQQKLNLRARAAGAALQIQLELQWFKEVENFTMVPDGGRINNDEKTPMMLFTETHEELVKEGEQWMKDTSNSCAIVAALIVTIVFAAAITVPGGNNGAGLPVFSQEKAFTVFAISDALALFSMRYPRD
ncbi:unnamed protein product [Ilex paraguariensis]|uniref:PGG domain-containing protein n=1 Tax=Ilex paraguariensis TaxID=185542 RepID=A0ABC8RI29_9AQUA